MVLEDQEYFLSQKSSHSSRGQRGKELIPWKSWPLAAPLDRIAASVVDLFIVLAPVIALAIAPFRRELMSSVLLNDRTSFTVALLFLVFVVLMTTLMYLTLMTWRFGATLGMMFMRLSVIRIWDEQRPDLYHSFLRSVAWMFNFVLLGLPNISAFSNHHRRILHDRISDTVVVSHHSNKVGSPSFFEFSLSRGVFVGIIALVIPVFGSRTMQFVNLAVEEVYSLEQTQEGDISCKNVDELLADGGVVIGQESRLAAAMTLYAAGALTEACLNFESDALFSKKIETPLTYFAKAFIYLNNPEVSNDYLNLVCKRWPESDACLMTQLVEKWAENDFESVNKLLERVSSKRIDYLNVWATRQLLISGHFDEASMHLERIPPNQALSRFIAFQNVKVLWGKKEKQKARSVASVSYSHLVPQDRLSMAGWLCHQESTAGCPEMLPESCQLVQELLLREPVQVKIKSAETLLGYVRAVSCEESGSLDYPTLARKVGPDSLKKYLAVLEFSKEKKVNEQIELFQSVVSNLDFDSVLRFDSQLRILSLTTHLKDVESIFKDWSISVEGQEWENVGFKLFQKLVSMQDYQSALDVGVKLAERKHREVELLEGLVLSSYRLGLQREAWGLYRKYFLNEKIGKVQRSIASSDEFEQIVKKLKKRFVIR